MGLRSPIRGMTRTAVLPSIAVLAATAAILLIAGNVLADGGAAGHLRLHAVMAIVLLAVAGVLAWRWPTSGIATLAPAIGLALLAGAQLLEAVGAAGFAADNDTRRSSLAALHDAGLSVSPIGMVATVVGVGIGVGVTLGRRGVARWIAFAAALALIGPGLLAIRTMVGL